MRPFGGHIGSVKTPRRAVAGPDVLTGPSKEPLTSLWWTLAVLPNQPAARFSGSLLFKRSRIQYVVVSHASPWCMKASPRLTGVGRPITAENRGFLLRFSAALLPTTTFRGLRSREDTTRIGKHPSSGRNAVGRNVRSPCSDGHCLSWKLMPSSSETGTPRAAPGSTHRHTASPPRKVCYSGVAHPLERKWKSGPEESAP